MNSAFANSIVYVDSTLFERESLVQDAQYQPRRRQVPVIAL